mmetsp:Transcript_1885/g.3412  ORF Transcript_1885/g.3412 Transcript_1885/m.3412 type:complete len:92 (-) Transcript_1885:238-513(-)
MLYRWLGQKLISALAELFCVTELPDEKDDGESQGARSASRWVSFCGKEVFRIDVTGSGELVVQTAVVCQFMRRSDAARCIQGKVNKHQGDN